MSKVKYAIITQEKQIGLLWENEKLGKVLVLENGVKISFNQDLEIYNVDDEKLENHVDLRDFLLEIIPKD